jgi:hypothetical protein
MTLEEAEIKLKQATQLIERTKAFIESDILKLADWIKQKYRLEDYVKSARQKIIELNAVNSEAGRRDEPDSCIPTAEREIASLDADREARPDIQLAQPKIKPCHRLDIETCSARDNGNCTLERCSRTA